MGQIISEIQGQIISEKVGQMISEIVGQILAKYSLTYSASSDFVSIASRLDNVQVIGEETGGAYRSYISGAMFGLVLPNSKIGVKIPTWKSILAFKEEPSNRGRGVIPDYPVAVSLDDFINGKDAFKDFAFELISSKQQ